MIKNLLLTVTAFLIAYNFSWAQQIVPIDDYSVNSIGQVQLEIQAQADKYYLLTVQHEPNNSYESITSMTMGVDGTLIISEPGGAFPLQNYKVTEYSIADPEDTDGDGIDDVTEFNNMPTDAPLNFASPVAFIDGTTSIPDAATFESLAVVEDVPWAPFLNGQQFVKFVILDKDTDQPRIYFINSETHFIHAGFLGAIGATFVGDDGSGEIVYNPNTITPNGVIGSYSFNFSFGDAQSFESTQRTYELLIANMPFLQNNMNHFIGSGGEAIYNTQFSDDYTGSRIEVVLESGVFADVDFIPFHQAEGYGFFRVMTLDENPGSRDIVLYDALPNSLPRVGGIITSVVQTPLSHVNLRAIQDNVPNAYIQNPLDIDSIANLVGNYIYYRVEEDNYFIREATLDEVNDWYENLRPTEEQIPDRDLSFTEILPLDSIKFEMSTAFGAKCSNVATMRTFGFPDGTIPDGFGVPFYFYDEFMKFNNFYPLVEFMINDSMFVTDLDTRIDMLKDLRDAIKAAPMPQWMLDELQVMHDAFPVGTAVRCRSSTNNEDLPGFSGAGLYTSKTQHLDEGHISKSIKQVYASMWNFRAFEERDFYRVDHFVAAMGVLCHPNFQEEKSNGVGVSIDPIYNTANTFYLNTQVGEDLITNPDANSIPEEILLHTDPDEGYFILRESNLVNPGELVMDEAYLDQMRDYLQVIHDEFAILYNVVGAPGFGMDIEYKVTAQDQLIIKQARPWVSFWADIKAEEDLSVEEIVEPQNSASLGDSELITTRIANAGLREMSDFEIELHVGGQLVETISVPDTIAPFTGTEYQFSTPQDFSTIGDYDVTIISTHPDDGYGSNDTLEVVLTKLHLLEGGLTIGETFAKCGNEVEVEVLVYNYGEATFNTTEIEVIANGVVVDTFIYDFSIPYSIEASFKILVTENLQTNNNEIILNLVRVNGQSDAVLGNNSASTTADLTSEFEVVTLIINADNYPQETSWEVYDELNNEIVAAGALTNGTNVFVEDVCVDYNSCFSLTVFDSFGDGICCGYGIGDFLMVNSTGDTLLTNNGEFGDEATEMFCPNGEGCAFTATIVATNTSEETVSDGTLNITTTSGISPFQYSIDGGQTFFASNSFNNLAAGTYDVVIIDAWGTCSYEESVEIEFDIIDNVDDLFVNQIKVFPNPTSDNLIIEVLDNSNITGTVQVEIYDPLGRLIHVDAVSNFGGQSQTIISLTEYPTGSYFVKCFNNDFQKYFKINKI